MRELRELAQRLEPEAVAILQAMEASDPLALNRALASVDERASRSVLRAGAAQRLARIDLIEAELEDATETAERECIEGEAERATAELADVEQSETRRIERIRQLLPKVGAQERERVLAAFRSREASVDDQLAELERAYQLTPPLDERRAADERRLAALRGRTVSLLERHVTTRSGSLGKRAGALRGSASVSVAGRQRIEQTLVDLGAETGDIDAALAAIQLTKAGLAGIASLAEEPDTGAELTSPIGYLHLERLSYVPAGVEHGELVYSLPLGPGEDVAIVHQEWANTEEEFQKLVADQFEDYSERGVVDKVDMAQASASQHSHSTQFNVAVSASGGFGPVSVSASSGFSASSSEQSSRQDSAARSQTVTKKASARARQEHRTSFRLAKKTQVEDQTVRRLRNPDPLHPVRYLKTRIAKTAYVHIWGCYTGALEAELGFDGDPVLDAYFARFALRNPSPGVARDVAMTPRAQVLRATYLSGSPKQLAAASELGLPFGTYRYQRRKALDTLATELRHRLNPDA